jgi:hypothetical protein
MMGLCGKGGFNRSIGQFAPKERAAMIFKRIAMRRAPGLITV